MEDREIVPLDKIVKGVIHPYRGIVQMVEQRSPKPYVIGSNPFAPANGLMPEADNPTYKNLRGRSYTISSIGIVRGKT